MSNPSDFEDRLQQAINRGQKRATAEEAAEKRKQMSQSEIKNQHNSFRLKLSEKIERSISKLTDHFPGFEMEVMYGERGWGAAIFRDDMFRPGQTSYSRLEVFVRPLSESNVVDLFAKGTIHNREVFNRNYHDDISNADMDKFLELIDLWILEYAEKFAAR